MKNKILKLIIQTIGLLGLIYAYNDYFFHDGVLFARKHSKDYPGVLLVLVTSFILVVGPFFVDNNDRKD